MGGGASGVQAFRWTSATGIEELHTPTGGVVGASAFGVSGDGSVVVGASVVTQSTGEAFRWTAATGIVGLGFLSLGPINSSEALGISADGSTIVGSSWALMSFRNPTIVSSMPFRGGMVGLGNLPGVGFNAANATSADGSTVVGTSGSQAFRWTSATGMVGLGALSGGTGSQALAVSKDGSTVVGTSTNKAFIWDNAGGMRDLNQVLTSLGLRLAGTSRLPLASRRTGKQSSALALIRAATERAGSP